MNIWMAILWGVGIAMIVDWVAWCVRLFKEIVNMIAH